MAKISKQEPSTVSLQSPRLKRELVTVLAMIQVYCRSHHSTSSTLCDHCSKLLNYAAGRLTHCTYADKKPTCGKCPVHCYKPAMRAEIINVMRFSGPRMILVHPYLAFRHLLDGRRVVKKLSCSDGKISASQGESHS